MNNIIIISKQQMYDKDKEINVIQYLTEYLQNFKFNFSLQFSIIESHIQSHNDQLADIAQSQRNQQAMIKKLNIQNTNNALIKRFNEKSPFSIEMLLQEKANIERFYLRMTQFLDYRFEGVRSKYQHKPYQKIWHLIKSYKKALLTSFTKITYTINPQQVHQPLVKRQTQTIKRLGQLFLSICEVTKVFMISVINQISSGLRSGLGLIQQNDSQITTTTTTTTTLQSSTTHSTKPKLKILQKQLYKSPININGQLLTSQSRNHHNLHSQYNEILLHNTHNSHNSSHNNNKLFFKKQLHNDKQHFIVKRNNESKSVNSMYQQQPQHNIIYNKNNKKILQSSQSSSSKLKNNTIQTFINSNNNNELKSSSSTTVKLLNNNNNNNNINNNYCQSNESNKLLIHKQSMKKLLDIMNIEPLTGTYSKGFLLQQLKIKNQRNAQFIRQFLVKFTNKQKRFLKKNQIRLKKQNPSIKQQFIKHKYNTHHHQQQQHQQQQHQQHQQSSSSDFISKTLRISKNKYDIQIQRSQSVLIINKSKKRNQQHSNVVDNVVDNDDNDVNEYTSSSFINSNNNNKVKQNNLSSSSFSRYNDQNLIKQKNSIDTRAFSVNRPLVDNSCQSIKQNSKHYYHELKQQNLRKKLMKQMSQKNMKMLPTSLSQLGGRASQKNFTNLNANGNPIKQNDLFQLALWNQQEQQSFKSYKKYSSVKDKCSLKKFTNGSNIIDSSNQNSSTMTKVIDNIKLREHTQNLRKIVHHGRKQSSYQQNPNLNPNPNSNSLTKPKNTCFSVIGQSSNTSNEIKSSSKLTSATTTLHLKAKYQPIKTNKSKQLRLLSEAKNKNIKIKIDKKLADEKATLDIISHKMNQVKANINDKKLDDVNNKITINHQQQHQQYQQQLHNGGIIQLPSISMSTSSLLNLHHKTVEVIQEERFT